MRIAPALAAFASMIALSATIAAAPLQFEAAAIATPVAAIADSDRDIGRNGYVTGFRSPVMAGLIEGRGRGNPGGSGIAAATLAAPVGGWTVTTAVATASVFLPILGGLPNLRAEPAPPVVALVLSLRDVGLLDGGAAALRRLIDGQRMGGDTDPIALLSSRR